MTARRERRDSIGRVCRGDARLVRERGSEVAEKMRSKVRDMRVVAYGQSDGEYRLRGLAFLSREKETSDLFAAADEQL
jgi:hypothetical protein